MFDIYWLLTKVFLLFEYSIYVFVCRFQLEESRPADLLHLRAALHRGDRPQLRQHPRPGGRDLTSSN